MGVSKCAAALVIVYIIINIYHSTYWISHLVSQMDSIREQVFSALACLSIEVSRPELDQNSGVHQDPRHSLCRAPIKDIGQQTLRLFVFCTRLARGQYEFVCKM